jgi:mannosyltransferase
VAVPAVVAAALCGYAIAARSLGFDEAATYAIASQHGAALLTAIRHDGGNMAGYYVFMHVLIGLFGTGIGVLRIPSVVATAATVAATAALGFQLGGRRVAFAAGMLAAVSLPLVYWGQTARGYAPMVAFATASWLPLASLTRAGPHTRAAWAGYALCLTLAVYCGLIALLVAAAQVLAVLWCRRPIRAQLSALAATAVACSPLAVLAIERGSGQLFWVQRPTLTAGKQVLQLLTSVGLEPSFRATATTPVAAVATIAALAAAVAVLARPRITRPGFALAAVLSWLTVPFALALVESFFWQPIFLPRNLLIVTPAVGLLIAAGLARERALGVSLLAALAVLRALQVTAAYGVSPEDWKAASARVLAARRPGDCIAFYPSDGRMAFDYYLGSGRSAPTPILPSAPWGTVTPYVERYDSLPPAQLARVPGRCPRVWLVSSHVGSPAGTAGSRANYARYVALRLALERSYPADLVSSFGYASAVQVELLTGAASSR